MTHPQFNKGIEDIQHITMTSHEKRGMLERIYAAPIPSPWSFGSWVRYHRTVAVMVTCTLVIVIAGGGVSLAAEQSLPGDALYAIKTNITEPARDFVVLTPTLDAEWQIEKADRRMQEVEILSSEGRLDAPKEAQVNKLLERHTSSLSKALDKIHTKNAHDADDISTTFEAEMNAHATVLDTISGRYTIGNATTSTTSIDKAEHARVSDTARAKAKKIEQRKDKESKNKKSVESFIEKTSVDLQAITTASTSTTSTIDRTILDNASTSLNQARQAFNRSELRDSERSAKETNVYIKALNRTNQKSKDRRNSK